MPNKNFIHEKQNIKEKELGEILEKYYPGLFAYVGDGSVVIGEYNPDFVSESRKLIIEFLGCYWHSCPVCKSGSKKEQEREARSIRIKAGMYGMNGYKTLHIWEHEFKHPINLIHRIQNFVDNGVNR